MHAVAGACRWPAARAAYGPPRDTRLRSTELRQFSRTERLRLCASHGNKGEGRQSGDRGSEQHVQSISAPFHFRQALHRRQRGLHTRTNAVPRSRAAPLRAAGDAACSSCSRRFQRAREELLERMGSHSSRVEPRATLAWRHAMAMARARTNRHEHAAAARLPPTPLAKLLRGMSRVCLTRCSVHQPRRYVPWRLATADTTPASTAGSSSGAALHRWLSTSSTLHSPRRRQALVTLAEED
jgi:hypothetical protein